MLEPCRWLERQGYELTVLTPDSQGNLTAEQVLEVVRPDTALVSMMLVNNELGNLYPIADIARGLAAKNPQTSPPHRRGSRLFKSPLLRSESGSGLHHALRP